jgi:asparagine synthase (glutamine-hydrolysing)
MKAAALGGDRVIIEGQGADEIFSGYTGYFRYHFRGATFMSLTRILESAIYNRGWLHAFKDLLLGMIRIPFLSETFRILSTADIGSTSLYKKLNMIEPVHRIREELSAYYNDSSQNFTRHSAHLVYKSGLQSLLRHSDRNSMRFSVESRVPYLYPQLIDACHSLPASFFVSRKSPTKYLLREIIRPFSPASIVERHDKVGFTPNPLNRSLLTNSVRSYLGTDLLSVFEKDLGWLSQQKDRIFWRYCILVIFLSRYGY